MARPIPRLAPVTTTALMPGGSAKATSARSRSRPVWSKVPASEMVSTDAVSLRSPRTARQACDSESLHAAPRAPRCSMRAAVTFEVIVSCKVSRCAKASTNRARVPSTGDVGAR